MTDLGRSVVRRIALLVVVVLLLDLLTPLLGLAHLGKGWFVVAGVLVAIFDPIPPRRRRVG
jgi:hypothetical protein